MMSGHDSEGGGLGLDNSLAGGAFVGSEGEEGEFL